ncbi:hypothetical protein D3C76_1462980 [compost metagenome]
MGVVEGFCFLELLAALLGISEVDGLREKDDFVIGETADNPSADFFFSKIFNAEISAALEREDIIRGRILHQAFPVRGQPVGNNLY